MELKVISDAYIGLDYAQKVVFTVRPAGELAPYAPHPDDLALDNEPTLFEQMMAANVDDDSSDEEAEEEEEAAVIEVVQEPTAKKGKNKKRGKKGAKVVVEDVDSEED